MMNRTFKGRVILPGRLQGEAVVTREGFNTLAELHTSVLEGAPSAVTGKILCLPRTIGSTSAGATWEAAARMGLAPKAMLFSLSIDSLAAAGLILADVWAQKRICTIDRLGERFLDSVTDGTRIEIHEDGTVWVTSSIYSE
jgi:predicted aconitase with swiveling domain